ncbi:tetrapyrrole biosynthesis, uroporphyrinogen III synthase [Polychaeton citri CBS 116435]|uniref:Tetrapyrrole biosynthesis, uroporphyrinogen III synthase n=1 Tax=Polychaeton citri CBS 116435 TaxID=1314669 RepID=A0A9P4QGA0_9PEZI|nr:tetrapyrrole biosynthesis, uroporphyrinogen III synthase [Polychaeton citri CBS 116435]
MEDTTTGLEDLSLDQIPIYLLKTKSSPSDGYEEYFEKDGKYMPIFVPVLEHMLMEDALRKLRLSAERFAFAGGSAATARQTATNNPAKKYSGMVFSSQRAVDAFATMVAKLNPDKISLLFDKDMPIYVVGPATAKGVRALDLPCPIVGEETGNGEALAKLILDHQKALPGDVTHLNGRKLPLLALVGEQRRDIIPKTLQSEEVPAADRIQVIEAVVYETGESATFEEIFTELLRAAKKAKVKEQWVIVFSPQGCEAMLSALGWLDEKTGRFNDGRREIVSGPMKSRVVTIGPTTRDYLIANFGFQPDVCAEKPSPEGVGSGIASYQS